MVDLQISDNSFDFFSLASAKVGTFSIIAFRTISFVISPNFGISISHLTKRQPLLLTVGSLTSSYFKTYCSLIILLSNLKVIKYPLLLEYI